VRYLVAMLIGAALASGTAAFAGAFSRTAGPTIRPGQWADYATSSGPWRCSNLGNRIECATGDAFPYAVLGAVRGRVGVIVHTLTTPGSAPRVSRDRLGRVYTFAS
jgi:hypothetical protein